MDNFNFKNFTENVLKINQTGNARTLEQKVIPRIDTKLNRKFLASGENLDILNKTDPRSNHFKEPGKKLPGPKECMKVRRSVVNRIDFLQRRLFAQQKYSVLLIFQGLDAAGKDGCIFRILKGVNPAGCQITGFQQPSKKELLHDFLWRTTKALPEKGKIGIFNRSYYEDVIVTKVHPEILQKQGINEIDEQFWQSRYESIRNFEKHLSNNGVLILKFFLNVSKKQQAYRLWKRLKNKELTWKFSKTDLEERKYWDNYMRVFNDTITQTNTPYAPWFIMPADNKHYLRMSVAQILESALRNLNIPRPKLQSGVTKKMIKEGKRILEQEMDGLPLYYQKTFSLENDDPYESEYPLDDTTTENLEKLFNNYTSTDTFDKKRFLDDKKSKLSTTTKARINTEDNIDLATFLKIIASSDDASNIV